MMGSVRIKTEPLDTDEELGDSMMASVSIKSEPPDPDEELVEPTIGLITVKAEPLDVTSEQNFQNDECPPLRPEELITDDMPVEMESSTVKAESISPVEEIKDQLEVKLSIGKWKQKLAGILKSAVSKKSFSSVKQTPIKRKVVKVVLKHRQGCQLKIMGKTCQEAISVKVNPVPLTLVEASTGKIVDLQRSSALRNALSKPEIVGIDVSEYLQSRIDTIQPDPNEVRVELNFQNISSSLNESMEDTILFNQELCDKVTVSKNEEFLNISDARSICLQDSFEVLPEELLKSDSEISGDESYQFVKRRKVIELNLEEDETERQLSRDGSDCGEMQASESSNVQNLSSNRSILKSPLKLSEIALNFLEENLASRLTSNDGCRRNNWINRCYKRKDNSKVNPKKISRLSETPEERRKRIRREGKRRWREQLSPEKVKEIRRKCAEYTALRRKKESLEETIKRREIERIRLAVRRRRLKEESLTSNQVIRSTNGKVIQMTKFETPEERKRRLQRERSRRWLAKQTPERLEEIRCWNALYIAWRRKNETPEETAKRRESERLRFARRRKFLAEQGIPSRKTRNRRNQSAESNEDEKSLGEVEIN